VRRLTSARPPKILIDARRYGIGGIGVYIKNLLDGLLSYFHEETVLPEVIISSSQETIFRVRYPYPLHVSPVTLYSFKEILSLGNLQYDIFHSPHFTLPLNLKGKLVVTLHDLIYFSHPPKFYHRALIFPHLYNVLYRATKIITVSEATKVKLEQFRSRFLSSNKTPIEVIPNAIKEIFLSNSSQDRKENFFLSVFSNLKPHRGFNQLLASYEALIKAFGEAVPRLKLVGMGVSGLTKKDVKEISFVDIIGEVDDLTLKSYYQKARALVIASQIEGFYLPAIEAHACGTPIISTPEPAIMELKEEGDFFAKTFSADDLFNAMRAFLLHVKPFEVSVDALRRFRLARVTSQTVKTYLDLHCN
jgi:glycosyltransferase involved in cell wall biosynthesis